MAGVTDLGLQVPPRGSAIIVKLLQKPDAARPRAWVTATWHGIPSYGRTANIGPESEGDLVVEGLRAGRVTVVVNVMNAGGAGATGGNGETVEVDGSSDVVIEVDLR